ncbi:hypothetical protein CYLTODRAFT_422854 [Cylindrobasidium torrendii FP15055 ss-10]|uniref:Kinetochore protein Spc24 n=1 Tax=Cylindrobasidium torrendii FP15055 ss-10 TaxID=1314674 RepID=A0A0D7B928_9AGAR|nr:hypothetical protein CYLTODRAFT_422854 [Cylindrobasidium torrendii FP15055 ss-10]
MTQSAASSPCPSHAPSPAPLSAEQERLLRLCLASTATLLRESRMEVLTATERELALVTDTIREDNNELHAEINALRMKNEEEEGLRVTLQTELAELREEVKTIAEEQEFARIRGRGDIRMTVTKVSEVEALTIGPGDKRVQMHGMEGGMVVDLAV